MKIFLLIVLVVTASNVLASGEAVTIYNTNAEKIALIQTHNNKIGTGFFVTPDLLLTNRHVVFGYDSSLNKWDAPKLILKKNGLRITSYKAMYCSRRVDVCLISLNVGSNKIEPTWPADRNIQVGEDLFVIGHPSGVSTPIISPGIASSERAKIPWEDLKLKQTYFDGFSTTAPISQGSSGSPVFSKRGEFLGLAVGSLTNSQNLNFVISANELNLFLDQVGLKDWESVAVFESGFEVAFNLLSKAMVEHPERKIDEKLQKLNQILKKENQVQKPTLENQRYLKAQELKVIGS